MHGLGRRCAHKQEPPNNDLLEPIIARRALPDRLDPPTMPTLDRWLHFLDPPVELNFRELTLMGRDFSPPIAVGRGTVRIPTLHKFEYSMRARVDDPAY